MNRAIVGLPYAARICLDMLATRALVRYSMPALRISLGLVFLGFGVLKFVPGLSPAEDLAQDTMGKLTFGIVPGGIGLVLVAALETAIGLCLVTGRHLRVGVALLGMAMIGVLSPIVLFPGELFAGPANAPTLEGQYVLKDLVLLAAALVVAAGAKGGRIVVERDAASVGHHRDADRPTAGPERPGLRRPGQHRQPG